MRLVQAKNHSFTAQVNNSFLHSRYSPEKEANKFFQKWLGSQKTLPRDIVVFDPGLGYLLDIVKNESSFERIIVIFYNRETYEYCRKNHFLEGTISWFPGAALPFEQFLQTHLASLGAEPFCTLEWSPSNNCFSSESKDLRRRFLQYMKILQGNAMTTIRFGRKWLYNGLRNYLEQDYSLQIGPVDTDTVIVASGYSLHRHLEQLRRNKDAYFIVALPSSVKALVNRGICPDLIITTDPGYYASLHYKCFPEESCLASPLASAPGNFGRRIVGIDQQSWLDKLLFPRGTPFAFTSPERGTVVATAMEVMAACCSRSLYLLGLDLCIEGIHEHAEPHEFDVFSTLAAGRLKPEIHHRFQRVHDMSAAFREGFHYTKSMETYEAWFRQRGSNGRIFRVGPSPVTLPFPEIASLPDGSRTPSKKRVLRVSRDYPGYRQRKEAFQSLMAHWNKELAFLSRRKTIDAGHPLGIVIQNAFPRHAAEERFEDLVWEMNRIMKKVSGL